MGIIRDFINAKVIGSEVRKSIETFQGREPIVLLGKELVFEEIIDIPGLNENELWDYLIGDIKNEKGIKIIKKRKPNFIVIKVGTFLGTMPPYEHLIAIRKIKSKIVLTLGYKIKRGFQYNNLSKYYIEGQIKKIISNIYKVFGKKNKSVTEKVLNSKSNMKKFCAKCGKNLRKNDNFCPKCGAKW